MERKRKTSRRQTVARRRRADQRRANRKQYRHRTRFYRRKQKQTDFNRRCRAVKQYRTLKNNPDISEKEAAQEVASRFGIGVSTLRKWDKKVRSNGNHFRVLWEKSSRPKTVVPSVSVDVIPLILAVRFLYGWGAQRIARVFAEQDIEKFSHMYVQRLFDKHFVKVRPHRQRAKRNGIAYKRYQKKAGNQQWHLDFKGPISIAGIDIWIFIVVDDATRFCLSARVIVSCSTKTVTDELTKLFQQYGTPERICTDNGKAFVSVWEGGHHQFATFLDNHDIAHDLITPYYPESNGKVEALIRIIKRECLEWFLQTRHQTEFQSVEELQQALDNFVEYYNWYRGHSALEYQTPGSVYAGYQPSHQRLGALPDVDELLGNQPLLQGRCKEPPPKVDQNFRKNHLALVVV